MDLPEMVSIDDRLQILHRSHEAVLNIWTEDGTEQTRLRKMRMKASSNTVGEAIDWLNTYRLAVSNNDLNVYLAFLEYLEQFHSKTMWKPIDYENKEEVAVFEGVLRAYELMNERVFM